MSRTKYYSLRANILRCSYLSYLVLRLFIYALTLVYLSGELIRTSSLLFMAPRQGTAESWKQIDEEDGKELQDITLILEDVCAVVETARLEGPLPLLCLLRSAPQEM